MNVNAGDEPSKVTGPATRPAGWGRKRRARRGQLATGCPATRKPDANPTKRPFWTRPPQPPISAPPETLPLEFDTSDPAFSDSGTHKGRSTTFFFCLQSLQTDDGWHLIIRWHGCVSCHRLAHWRPCARSTGTAITTTRHNQPTAMYVHKTCTYVHKTQKRPWGYRVCNL